MPTAIKVYNWVLTLWRGDIHLTVPMLFALGFIVTFVNGGLTGLFLGNVVVDVPLSDTMFVVAHFHMVMGVAPIMVIFGAIYHWYPKITGRMLDDTLGKFHFWVTFLGAYAIFFPMHYLGLMGVPRRYYELGETAFIPPSAHTLNAFITVVALIVGAAQLVFLFNLIWSLRHGRPAGGNPWRATTLEWQTPETPPAHGNWGQELPVVYRWAYDYSVPGAAQDFIPQNEPPAARPAWEHDHGHHRILPGWSRRSRLVAVAAATDRKALAGGGRDRRSSRSRAPALPTAKIGLGVFLGVVGSLFALFVSAYTMRMQWARTGARCRCRRCCGSTPASWSRAAWRCTGRRSRRAADAWTACGRGCSRAACSPWPSWAASSWPGGSSMRPATSWPPTPPIPSSTCSPPCTACTCWAAWSPWPDDGQAGAAATSSSVRLSVELCAIYWHFLLFVWLVLFALLLHH